VNATVESKNGFVYYTFEGNWDWDEFYRVIERVRALYQDYPSDGLLDFRYVSQISPDAVLHLKPAAQIAEQSNRRYIVLAGSSSIQTIFMLFRRIYSSLAPRFFLVHCLEDAYAVLVKLERNPSLSPETA
jgi:hypothetical protein